MLFAYGKEANVLIDFQNAKYLKLRQVEPDKFLSTISPMLLDGETIVACYQSVRDYLLFTTKRVISVNVQGVTGRKQDFTSLPYSKIQAFSVESAGMLDLDAEMELWFSGLGRVHLEFLRGTDIGILCKLIGNAVL